MSAFLNWVSNSPPMAADPDRRRGRSLIVVAIILSSSSRSPRAPGRMYTIIRLAACVLFPLLVLPRARLGLVGDRSPPPCSAGCSSGSTIARKQGAGYLFQLVRLPGPAILLLVVGLIFPTIQTIVQAFLNSRGNRVRRARQLRLDLHAGRPASARSSTRSSGCSSPRRSRRPSASPTPYFIDKSRGEKYYKILVFMPMAISFVGASHHLALHVHGAPGGARRRSASSTRSSSGSAASRTTSSPSSRGTRCSSSSC